MGSTAVPLALLLWFAGPLHGEEFHTYHGHPVISSAYLFIHVCFSTLSAQRPAGSCRRPQLANGYFLPEAEFYDREDQIVYSCEKGHKPAAKNWWVTSSCQGGTWFPKPQCIGACFLF